MPSPFPGMIPYLEHEEVWQDCHQDLTRNHPPLYLRPRQ
jgi:hypothetical protein